MFFQPIKVGQKLPSLPASPPPPRVFLPLHYIFRCAYCCMSHSHKPHASTSEPLLSCLCNSPHQDLNLLPLPTYRLPPASSARLPKAHQVSPMPSASAFILTSPLIFSCSTILSCKRRFRHHLGRQSERSSRSGAVLWLAVIAVVKVFT